MRKIFAFNPLKFIGISAVYNISFSFRHWYLAQIFDFVAFEVCVSMILSKYTLVKPLWRLFADIPCFQTAGFLRCSGRYLTSYNDPYFFPLGKSQEVCCVIRKQILSQWRTHLHKPTPCVRIVSDPGWHSSIFFSEMQFPSCNIAFYMVV